MYNIYLKFVFKNILGFHIRLVVAGQFKTEWRVYHRYHGHWLCLAIRYVQYGSDECSTRADGCQSARHQDMSGGRLSGVCRVRHRTPVSKSVGTGAWLLLDGCLAGMLDRVPDRSAHGARI